MYTNVLDQHPWLHAYHALPVRNAEFAKVRVGAPKRLKMKDARKLVRSPSHARHGNVQVSVKALGPARRKTRRSVLWTGSTLTSTPARNPRT